MDLPMGTVTFLFTDIEGSARLWDRHPQTMHPVLARHDALLSGAITAAGGRVIKHKGDGFIAAFGEPRAAVEAAVAGQRLVAEEEWPEPVGPIYVRMALHAGAVAPTGQDYFGPELNRTARIEAAGHGGQVLVSGVVLELLGDALPHGVTAVDLGEHALRGLSRPERIHQLSIDGLRSEFPLLQSGGMVRDGLPDDVTSFVGREAELGDIGDILDDPGCRLITLLGPGGIGKSRLAIEAARRRKHEYPNGVQFVPLAPLPAVDGVLPAITNALEFAVDTHSSSTDPRTQLLDYLGRLTILLVLDNFEHLLDGAPLVTEMLAAAPRLRVMVTSRDRLSVGGEWVYTVPALAYPADVAGGDGGEFPAIRLYRERAGMAGAKPSPDDIGHVARICRLTGGIPLGIELAAAWAGMLSAAEIAGEIAGNLDFLESTRQDLPDRHRSLRAAFDYSWRLLDDGQRRGFARLAVFRGGFTREAATEVCGLGVRDLAALVDKSLVYRSVSGRFDLHQILRQFAAEKLDDDPEQADIRLRHARAYTNLLIGLRDELTGAGQLEARDLLRRDYENLRIGVDRAVVEWPAEVVLVIVRSLRSFFHVSSWHDGAEELGRLTEVARRRSSDDGEAVIAALQASHAGMLSILGEHEAADRLAGDCLPILMANRLDEDTATALLGLGAGAAIRGEYAQSLGYLNDAADISRRAGAGNVLAAVLLWRGWDLLESGRFEEAGADFDQSLALYTESGNQWGKAFALSKLGLIAHSRGDLQEALDYHHEGRESFVKLGDIAGEAYTLSRLSWALWSLGRYQEAREYGCEAFDHFDRIGHRWGMGASRCRVAFAELALGNGAAARELFSDALDVSIAAGITQNVVYALIGVAAVLADAGKPTAAATLVGAAQAWPGIPAPYAEYTTWALDMVGEQLGREAIDRAVEEGGELDVEGAVAFARAES